MPDKDKIPNPSQHIDEYIKEQQEELDRMQETLNEINKQEILQRGQRGELSSIATESYIPSTYNIDGKSFKDVTNDIFHVSNDELAEIEKAVNEQAIRGGQEDKALAPRLFNRIKYARKLIEEQNYKFRVGDQNG